MKKVKFKKILITTLVSFLLIVLLLVIYIKYSEHKLNQIISIEKQDMGKDTIKKNIQPKAKQILDSLYSIP